MGVSFSAQIGRFRAGNRAPLYLQLQQLLREAIYARVLRFSDAIPPERELASEYAVSRMTVRQAILGLVDEGLLTRRRGAGTFVAARVEKSLSRITSFSEDMAARGMTPSSAWISRAMGKVTPEESLSLGLSPGEPVYRFQRLRLADEVPMAFERATIAGFALPSEHAVDSSLYMALEVNQHRPIRVLQRLRAILLTGDHSQMLGVAAGHAGLLIERRGFLLDGRAVEFTKSIYRGDAYDFVAELVED